MKSRMLAAARALNRMIHKMGHFLTLAAALTLWFGIFSTIPFEAHDSAMKAESVMPEYMQNVPNDVSRREGRASTQVVADSRQSPGFRRNYQLVNPVDSVRCTGGQEKA